MSELLKKQNYGVEVEFTGISRKMAADAVAEIIGTTASRPDHTCYQTRTIQDSQGRKWKVMRDSSINPIRKVGTENMDEYRVEFVTPVLKYEDLDTLQAIIRKFREIGGVPHASCGIHIHVDGANHTATGNWIPCMIAPFDTALIHWPASFLHVQGFFLLPTSLRRSQSSVHTRYNISVESSAPHSTHDYI